MTATDHITKEAEALAVIQTAIRDELSRLWDDHYLPPKYIAAIIEIPHGICCAILRDMRERGVVEFRKGLVGDDGEFRGCGYRLAPGVQS